MNFLRTAVLCLVAPVNHSPAVEHFEARHTHPLDLTPDGTRLLAVNSHEGRLSVFALNADPRTAPALIAEIPAGLEPVTVRAASNTQAWVVNELSDTVSIIDLTRRAVIHTLSVPDEPADVVFAGSRAFVSCGRANAVAVFDRETFAEAGRIPLQGVFPRALAVSPDGTRVFAAMLLSGNNTTVLHFRQAPPQPAPVNPTLPEPPQTALIVPDTDPRVSWDVLDHDIAEIDTGTLQVTRYLEGAGTNVTALAMQPDGTLWAAAQEARNLIRFEPALNGVFMESRAVKFTGMQPQVFDLNPAATSATAPPAVKDLALAQPMALLATGSTLWTAAFTSDRIAELSPGGTVLRRIDLRTAGSPSTMRGPRGLSLHAASGRLFVLNKLSQTLSAVDAARGSITVEIPLSSHAPMPATLREGQASFYDARLSGNGTVSCGSCHLDADNDGIAWDLGDPAGAMALLTGYSVSVGEPWPVERPVHPMKGPMVTQTLRGLRQTAPFHWRGDKARLQDFNGSYASLLAGALLPEPEMDKVAAWLESVRNHPNPNRNPDNSLKPLVAGGDPARGRVFFEEYNTCSKCHTGGRGTNHLIDEFTSVLTRQPVKNATLEHSWKKVFFTPDAPVSLSGFGFTHDGSGHLLPRGHEYDQDRFHLHPGAAQDVTAYVLSAETDTPPAAAQSRLLTHTANITAPETAAFCAMMEAQAALGRCDVVLTGILGGECRSLLYDPATGLYESDRSLEPPLPLASLSAQLQPGDSLLLLGVTPGSGSRYSIDRDGDGLHNADEPAPTVFLLTNPLRFPAPAVPGWFREHSADLQSWAPALLSADDVLPAAPLRGFYRHARTW